jgi:hypothetical protein
MPRPEIFPTLETRSVEAIVAFVRAHQINAAHYFGYADEGLIRALRAEPGFTITLTDYFDRWGCSQRFWGNDEGEDYPIPPCPEWLENVDSYEEGMAPASMLIWDLDRAEDEKLTRVTQPFDFIAATGAATNRFWPIITYKWHHEAGTWLGTRKRPADLR